MVAKKTTWTPEIVADSLISAHGRWTADGEHGHAARKAFNPAYLKKIGFRQVYDENRNNDIFARGLALASESVRNDWTNRPHTEWTEKKVVARLQGLFQKWWKEVHLRDPSGTPWSLSYLNGVDKTFVRVTLRLGFKIEAIIKKRLGGDIRTYWRPTRQLTRRPRVAPRTSQSAAQELTAAFRRWRTDAAAGNPAGRPFGPEYLRRCGEERLEAWMRRNRMTEMVLAFAPKHLGRAWKKRVTA